MNRVDAVSGQVSGQTSGVRGVVQRAHAAKDSAELTSRPKVEAPVERVTSVATYGRGVKKQGIVPDAGLGGMVDVRG